jgi:hypothetical protein
MCRIKDSFTSSRHRQVNVTPKVDVHMKHVETMLCVSSKRPDDQLQYLGLYQAYLKDLPLSQQGPL